MNAIQATRPQKTMSRALAVGAALGVALAIGPATAASAASPVTEKATAAQYRPTGLPHHGGGDEDGGCEGLIVLLCN
ncbi:hypothetical protein [Streptomyces sp. NPDC006739]|uniref:hypothetical protein n=1 Tax=Streptomyces sp. NPDC006739 TaxID=3364763 RepID=UPI0036947AF7